MMIALSLALYLSLAATHHLPFSIDATEDAAADFPDAPRVESASFGQWNGRWLFIGGRVAGYHAMGGATADFSRPDANRNIWVVDTNVRPARTYHLPVDSLPANLSPLRDQWMATGQAYCQAGAALYIAGGYGQDASGHWLTYPLLSKIDLPSFIDSVMRGSLDSAAVRFVRSSLVQSAGGDLVKVPGDSFYLVMGHVFTGNYTAFEAQGEHNSAPVSQTYLNEIRRLKLTTAPDGAIALSLLESFRDDTEFHRRDLNVTQTLSSEGVGLAAYGGVFTPDQLNYSKPVYLHPGEKPVVDSHFEQKLNTYRCARVLFYDPQTAVMYTTFLGGISRFHWNAALEKFTENPKTGSKTEGHYLDGLQWSDQISTLSKSETASAPETLEVVQPGVLPAFIGTEAVFIPASGLRKAAADTDILDLSAFPRGSRTLVGYLYGGIRAYPFRFPYTRDSVPYDAGTVPTKPSDLVLKVYLTVN